MEFDVTSVVCLMINDFHVTMIVHPKLTNNNVVYLQKDGDV